jgi:hypothetical protein
MENAVNEFKRRLKLGSDGKVHILSPNLIHHGTPWEDFRTSRRTLC